MTDVSPHVLAPVVGGYTLCNHYGGRAPDGNDNITIISCNAPVKGRYLVVQIPGSDERLTMCEVEVLQPFSGKEPRPS